MTTGKRSPANRPPAADRLTAASRTTKEPRRQRMDGLLPAGVLAGFAAAGVILVTLLAAFDMLQGMRPVRENTIGFYRAVGLGYPALIPAGREARHPFPGPPAVPGRYLPTLPKRDPGPIHLLDQDLAMPHEAAKP